MFRDYETLDSLSDGFGRDRRYVLLIAIRHRIFYSLHMELLNYNELTRLTPRERLALISQLWDSLDNEQLPLTAAQRDEIDRRLDTLDTERRDGVTWEALKAELESRCP